MTEIELTQVCTEMAKYMTRYGAEISRVEDTTRRICRAYSIRRPEIYATPANFIITICDIHDVPVTNCAVIGGRSTNLDRLGRLNDLSRWICSRRPDKDSIIDKIKEINNRPTYTSIMYYITCFAIGAAYTIMYGGNWIEAIVSAVIAALIRFVKVRLSRVTPSIFFASFTCAAVMTLITMLLLNWGVLTRFDHVLIAVSITMVPGVAITNGMRDFISGDVYSGIYSLTEALTIAIGLAVGTGIVLSTMLGDEYTLSPNTTLPALMNLVNMVL